MNTKVGGEIRKWEGDEMRGEGVRPHLSHIGTYVCSKIIPMQALGQLPLVSWTRDQGIW